jgi:hypothetical protein
VQAEGKRPSDAADEKRKRERERERERERGKDTIFFFFFNPHTESHSAESFNVA